MKFPKHSHKYFLYKILHHSIFQSIILFLAFICISLIGRTQSVIASGQEPAWTLDYDGGKNLVLYVGENSFADTVVSKPGPEGSSKEISKVGGEPRKGRKTCSDN